MYMTFFYAYLLKIHQKQSYLRFGFHYVKNMLKQKSNCKYL